ncbi:MAG TPA: glycosyltransferase [Pyrinomonadaceae bacterium]|jgi:glycosyltransferase involved in cell wall biosynthesis
MSSAPTVTIIIPAYNVAPYIDEALESVFAQTFADYEVIIVNDGSSDTEDLERRLESFSDRIRYFKQENRGAGAARNVGLRAARGEFIAFLDADDLWLPNYLEEQLEFIREHDGDLVCANAINFGDSVFAGRTYMEFLMPGAAPTGRITFLGLVSAKQSLNTPGVVTRRQSIIDVGFFDEGLRNSQDFDLWLRLINKGARAFYHDRVLVKIRWRAGSLSGDEINRMTRQLKVLRKIETDFDLPKAEREAVARAIAGRRTLLRFELGKIYLSQGEFEKAKDSFTEALAAATNWKAAVALWAAKLCPHLLQTIYLRRLNKARHRFA